MMKGAGGNPLQEGDVPTQQTARKVGGLSTFLLLFGAFCTVSSLPQTVISLAEGMGWALVGTAALVTLVGLGLVVRDLAARRADGLPLLAFVALLALTGFAIARIIPGVLEDMHFRTSNLGRGIALGGMKAIAEAQEAFRGADHDKDGKIDYGTLEELVAARLVPEYMDLLGTGSGHIHTYYTFECLAFEDRWLAIATPGTRFPGDLHYCMNQEGVLFFRDPRRSPPFELNDACEIPADARVYGGNLHGTRRDQMRAPSSQTPSAGR